MRRTHCISDGELCISDGELCISEGPIANAGVAAPFPAPAAAPPSSTASSAAVAPAGRDMFRDMPPSSTASSVAVAPAGQWQPVASQRASASNSARAEVGTIRRCGTRLRAPSIRAAARCGEHLHARQAIRMQSTYLRSVRRRAVVSTCMQGRPSACNQRTFDPCGGGRRVCLVECNRNRPTARHKVCD
jgi:hypothetical protein